MFRQFITKGKRVILCFIYCTITLTLLGCSGNKNDIDTREGTVVTNSFIPTRIGEYKDRDAENINAENEEGRDKDERNKDEDRTDTVISSTKDIHGNDGIKEAAETATITSTQVQEKKSQEQLLASWDYANGPILLERVLQELEENAIPYEGYYNVSKERVDIQFDDKNSLVFLKIYYPEVNKIEPSYGYELMLKGNVFNKSGFTERYLYEYDVTTSEYMEPNLSKYEIDMDILMNYDQTRLSIARNQLFAKNGYKFSDPFLYEVFLQKDWYVPRMEGEQLHKQLDIKLTAVEKKNLARVLEIEERNNYSMSKTHTTLQGLVTGSWMDLDLDGKREQIKYEKERISPNNRFDKIRLTILDERGTTIATVEREVESGSEYLYISITEDGTYHLAIAEDGASADYRMEFFQFYKKNILEIGSILSFPESIRISSNAISALVETSHIQNESIRFHYIIQNNKMIQLEEDFYQYRGNEVVSLVEIELYENKGANNSVSMLKKGDRIRILGGDLTNWVQVESVVTKKIYWIIVKDGYCILSNGTQQYSGICFEGLTIYG